MQQKLWLQDGQGLPLFNPQSFMFYLTTQWLFFKMQILIQIFHTFVFKHFRKRQLDYLLYVSFLFIIVHVQVQNESRSRCTRWYQAGQNLQRDFGRRYAAGKYKSFCSVDAIEIFIFRFSVQILSTVLTALTFIVYHYKIIVSFMVKIGYFL